jgi:DegV family protein with EDD domain
MVNIAIVTDSSADLTPEQQAAGRIIVVPLTVAFGPESFAAGTELTNEAFYERLTAPGAPFPRTAAPSPAAFEAAFRAALDGGADAVLCPTISSGMSATFSNATLAARELPEGRVAVVDTKTVTLGLGLIVREAAEAALAGADLATLEAQALQLRERTRLFFGLETLEYLRRGGRIGRAQALLGSILSIKPILTVEDGTVAVADRQRTAGRVRARLLELIAARPVERISVLHILAPGIESFADEVAAAVGVERSTLEIGQVGPVAGAHVGPGCYGAALILAA